VLRGTNDTPTAIVGYVNLEYKYKRTTRPLWQQCSNNYFKPNMITLIIIIIITVYRI